MSTAASRESKEAGEENGIKGGIAKQNENSKNEDTERREEEMRVCE